MVAISMMGEMSSHLHWTYVRGKATSGLSSCCKISQLVYMA